jgi:hypothetical protein
MKTSEVRSTPFDSPPAARSGITDTLVGKFEALSTNFRSDLVSGTKVPCPARALQGAYNLLLKFPIHPVGAMSLA